MDENEVSNLIWHNYMYKRLFMPHHLYVCMVSGRGVGPLFHFGSQNNDATCRHWRVVGNMRLLRKPCPERSIMIASDGMVVKVLNVIYNEWMH